MMIGHYMVYYIHWFPNIYAAFGINSLIIPEVFLAFAHLYFLYIPTGFIFLAVMSSMFDNPKTAGMLYGCFA